MAAKARRFCLCALPLAAAAAAGEAPVARLAAPARLGAAESKGSYGFQILDWNGDGARDIVQRASKDRGWILINRGTDREPWFELPTRLPLNTTETEPAECGYVKDWWIGDIDGNGTPDVVSIGAGDAHVSVNTGPGRHSNFLGKANGFLSKPPPVWNPDRTTQTPRWMCEADLDGDGQLEYVYFDHKLNLRCYRQALDGKSFQLGESWEVKDPEGKPVGAPLLYPVDFDGDGAVDLAAASADGKVVIHLAVKESRGRTLRPAVPALDEAGRPLAAGNDLNVLDWNLDGIPDLLVLDDSCIIRCHYGREKGKPVFAAAGAPITGNAFARACSEHMPCLVDLDKDGRADLLLKAQFDICCGSGNDHMRVYRNVLGAGGPTAFAAGTFVHGKSGTWPLGLDNFWGGDPCAADFDGDGRLDIVFWRMKGKDSEICLLRGEGEAPPLTSFKASPAVLLTVPWSAVNANYPVMRPFAADWNGDGRTDLVIGAMVGGAPRVFLALNEGTAAAPKFGGPVPITADGKEVAYGTACCVADWDGDGRPDLIGPATKGEMDPGPLHWSRNADGGAKVAAGREIAGAIPGGKHRKFSAGDVDGDGVADLVVGLEYFNGFFCISEGQLWWLRGVPPGAPARVADLTARDATEDGVTLAWAPPAGAARVEVRYSPWPIDEATWFRAAPVKEAPKDGALTVRGLEKGRTWHFAACSFGPDGRRSEVSNCPAAATRPLVLTTIPASAAAGGRGLSSGNSGLQFSLAALKGKTVRRATLTLSTASGGRVSGDKTIVCREASAAEVPALPDLYAEPLLGRKEWDATESVRRLVKAGEATLGVRLSGGPQDVVFAGPEAADAAARPRLTVVLEETK